MSKIDPQEYYINYLKTKSLGRNQKDLQDKLDHIASKATNVKSVKGKIQLNPNNSLHNEWYEEDYIIKCELTL